jgi:hypothetical protein
VSRRRRDDHQPALTADLRSSRRRGVANRYVPRDGPGAPLIRDGAISLMGADQDSMNAGVFWLRTASRKAPPLPLMNDGLSLTPSNWAVFARVPPPTRRMRLG